MSLTIAKKFYSLLSQTDLRGEIARGGLGALSIKVVALILGFISSVVLARALGPADYGTFSFYLSLAMMAALPALAGLPSLIVRECSKYIVDGKWEQSSGLLKSANYFAFFTSLIVVILVFLFSNPSDKSEPIFFGMLMLVPVLALTAVRTGTLRSLKKVVWSQVPEQVVRPLILILIVAGFHIWGVSLDHNLTMMIYLISALLAFVLGYYVLKRWTMPELSQASPKYDLSHWGKSWFFLFVYSGTRLADAQLANVMIGFLATSHDVGLYRAASQLCSLVVLSLTVVNLTLAPYIARFYAKREIKQIEAIVKMMIRLASLWALVIATSLMVWGEEIITLIFGQQYISADLTLSVLSLAQLINVSLGSVGLVLMMTGHDKDCLKASVIGLTIGGLLMAYLVPVHGHLGAAVAFLVSTASWNLIMMLYLKKRLNINVSAF